MSWDNEDMLEKILYLLDKFCISDEAYHELSMITDDLPKSYLIKRSRLDLNNTYSIERTQGKYPGAKLDFTSTLINHVKDLLVNNQSWRGNNSSKAKWRWCLYVQDNKFHDVFFSTSAA